MIFEMDMGEGPISNRVLRGGSWNNNNDRNLRSSNRNNNNPDNTNNNNGFRCSRDGEPCNDPSGKPESGEAFSPESASAVLALVPGR